MDSEIHKISWQDITLKPGKNQISVVGYKNNKNILDECEWSL